MPVPARLPRPHTHLLCALPPLSLSGASPSLPAGLVIAVTGNFLVILATAAFNLSGPADQPQLNGGYGGSGGSKAIDGGSGV